MTPPKYPNWWMTHTPAPTVREEPPTGWSSHYYELPPEAEELQDLIEYRDMNFAVGNIFKAAYRLGRKPGTDVKYDLEKIIWYAQRELSRCSPPERK